MSSRRRPLATLLALVALALAVRAAPLYWSGYPSTLDGFGHAAFARTAVRTASIPLTVRADSLLFGSLLATTGLVLDVDPLRLAQPLATTIGAGICFVGAVVARRVAREVRLPSVTPTRVALFAAALLAVEGLFLRRTSVPDEELVGILFVLVLAVSLHAALRTGLARWYAVAGLLLAVFPITHTFSSLLAALVTTALVARHVTRALSLRSLAGGGALALGFWVYMAGYYRLAESYTPLVVPYVDRITAYPGLFLAWLVVLVVGVVWVQRTGPLAKRAAYLAVVGSFFAVVLLNAFTPIFPGTVTTPRVILLLVGLLSALALAAAASLDVVSAYRGGAVVAALFLAPVVVVGFALTASLTPEYYGTVMRAQTFLHFPAALLGAVTLARLSRVDGSRAKSALGVGVVALVLVATVASAPLAFLTVDTAAVPSTTLSSEFESVEFASENLHARWASDHSLTRVGALYFGANVTYDATASWLTGGPSPPCPVISQRSWTTTGAHLFPTAPRTVSTERYARWLRGRNVVYSANGLDPVVVSVPVNADGFCR
jgi:hypothetical protein